MWCNLLRFRALRKKMLAALPLVQHFTQKLEWTQDDRDTVPDTEAQGIWDPWSQYLNALLSS